MRVAASDFDGTLYRNGEVTRETVQAIRDWRALGNKFGVATGRDLSMMKLEMERFDFPCDFLVCVNGAAIYDHDLQLLHSVEIDDELVPAILSHPAGAASLHYEFCRDGVISLFNRENSSFFPDLGLPYQAIGYDEAMAMKRMQQISLAYIGAEECKEWTRQLNETFAGRVQAHQNVNCIDITAFGVNKAVGIKTLLEVTGWPEKGLLVIGDGHNDIDMIRNFAGFSVPGSGESVRRVAREVYGSVGDMLNDLS